MARDPASIRMRAASQRLRQIVRRCEAPVACLGPAPRIQAVDRAFERQLGWSASMLETQPLEVLAEREARDRVELLLERVLADQVIARLAVPTIDGWGRRRDLHWVGVPSFGLAVPHEGWVVIGASGCADDGPTPTASHPTQADAPTDAIPDGPPRIVHDQPCDERTSLPSPSGIVTSLPMTAQDDVTALSRPLGSI